MANSKLHPGDNSKTGYENQVRLLYQELLKNWNNNNADGFANLFAPDGNSVGFDGSQMNGREEIKNQIKEIFKNHKVSSYVGIIREIRQLSPTVFLVRGDAGMVPPGQNKIKPDVNSIQSMIAQILDGNFLIALFHNTPAAFHGRPQLSQQLTQELQEAFNSQKNFLNPDH